MLCNDHTVCRKSFCSLCSGVLRTNVTLAGLKIGWVIVMSLRL
uniref:Uncharacterized protein n=1 Tax=Anguilla anguilla TaxID=7936 RepID=A0A0E9R7I0_ANGAN